MGVLESKNCYDANFVLTANTVCCHRDNPQCCQWWHSWRYDISQFSVCVKWVIVMGNNVFIITILHKITLILEYETSSCIFLLVLRARFLRIFLYVLNIKIPSLTDKIFVENTCPSLCRCCGIILWLLNYGKKRWGLNLFISLKTNGCMCWPRRMTVWDLV